MGPLCKALEAFLEVETVLSQDKNFLQVMQCFIVHDAHILQSRKMFNGYFVVGHCL